jgi:HK97 gp10 family phage protein
MSKFDEVLKEMENKKQVVLKTIGLFCEGEAKLRTPVDTGNLRGSITHEIDTNEDGGKVWIGTNVEYAPYVEFGVMSKNIPAQPFLLPSVEENLGQIKDIIQKGLSK